MRLNFLGLGMIEGQAVAQPNLQLDWCKYIIKGDWPIGNCKRHQGTLECFGTGVPGVWDYHLPAGSPPTASAHMLAPGYLEQLRTMTGQGVNVFLCFVLNSRPFVPFDCILCNLPLVLHAIARNSYLYLFFHPLMASEPFHSCTYVEVVSRRSGSHLSSCLHSLSTRQSAMALCLRVVSNLVPGVELGRWPPVFH